MDEDFLLAVQLQEQFDHEAAISSYKYISEKSSVALDEAQIVSYRGGSPEPERSTSIVDESWELLDPNPDVRAMFLSFNDKFFWGKLSAVEVRWSPRMTLCAGLCCYEGRGGLCSIRLSEPLLKLRPRRDLVQTLLHEMIHALLFVTQNNRDREEHGPEFCKHMDRINKASGTNITVYHNFHDEVDLYRQHWWRCNGPCQNWKPFFGYVKRAMNRAPSARDPWWENHQHSCGGTFTKIKEPENYKKGKKDTKGHTQPADKAKSGVQDIRNVLPFSGKGFVLGGNPRPFSPKKQLELSYGKPPADCSGLTKTLWSSFSIDLTKDFSGPGESSQDKTDDPGAVSSGSRGQKSPSTKPNPQTKKSVSNTNAFVNINGSPVRISGTLNSSFSRAKQKSFSDLFSPSGSKSSPWAGMSSASCSASTPPTKTTCSSNTTKDEGSSGDLRHTASSSNSVNVGQPGSRLSSSPANSSPGFCLNSKPEKPSSTLTGSRKRPFDTSTSTHISDFFKKRTGTSSAVSKTRETSVPPATHSFGQSALPPAAQAAPARATDPTVSCPVCQTTILESKINEHLDSCLT